MTIIYFIIALGLLIFVHEFGHFIVAKRRDIKVEVFSLGFGPRLIGFKIGETDYRISLLPLGGYVKMLGEDASDENAKGDPRSFAAKSIWSRTKVIAAGPIMNLFFCLLVMPIVFMIGREEPQFLKEPPVIINVRAESPATAAGLESGDKILSVDGAEVKTWEDLLNKIIINPGATLSFRIERGGNSFTRDVAVDEIPELKGGYVGIEPMFFFGNEAVIDAVKPGGPADRAGLKSGDMVKSFAGKEIKDWLDLSAKVDESKGEASEIVIVRDGQEMQFTFAPVFDESFHRWLIGISKDRKSGVPMQMVRYGFFDAVKIGTLENIKLAELTLDVLKRLVTLKLSYKVLGGPIIIAKTSAVAAAGGISAFLYFLCFLSLQLGILNFLPIPVLDGGHIMFLGIEAVMRRPLSERVRSVADQAGFVLLIALMILVTYNDLNNIWGIVDKIKNLW